MKDWITNIPIVQKLVVLFKYILSVRGYNSNFTGGIGSYCVFVMIAAYVNHFGVEEDPNLGKYFENILKWYGQEFDNINNVVTLKNLGHCFVDENNIKYENDEGKRGLLKLIDPITGRLMSSSCLEYNNIKIEFRRILAEMASWE
jgi:DNA polymerase sigma